MLCKLIENKDDQLSKTLHNYFDIVDSLTTRFYAIS